MALAVSQFGQTSGARPGPEASQARHRVRAVRGCQGCPSMSEQVAPSHTSFPAAGQPRPLSKRFMALPCSSVAAYSLPPTPSRGPLTKSLVISLRRKLEASLDLMQGCYQLLSIGTRHRNIASAQELRRHVQRVKNLSPLSA